MHTAFFYFSPNRNNPCFTPRDKIVDHYRPLALFRVKSSRSSSYRSTLILVQEPVLTEEAHLCLPASGARDKTNLSCKNIWPALTETFFLHTDWLQHSPPPLPPQPGPASWCGWISRDPCSSPLHGCCSFKVLDNTLG